MSSESPPPPDSPAPNLKAPKHMSKVLLVLGLSAVVSLGGGAALLVLSKTGSIAVTGGTGPGLASAVYEAGGNVNIWWHDHWYPGVVESVDGERYSVRYLNRDAKEWVDPTRLQPR